MDTSFTSEVWEYYQAHGRHDLPWRSLDNQGVLDPYHVVVSELMLQQTQVSRVVPKYRDLIELYPSFASLAAVPLSSVLIMWNGLGYNRRAKFLWQTAQIIAERYSGKLPDKASSLISLPGIGPNTAGAVLAYAFNRPVTFIETNIRTVFIHHFFPGETKVPDAALEPLIAGTLPEDNPREWYWALMDYGTYIKQTVGNVSRASAHFTKQSTFKGSRRQVRGQVIRLLAARPHTKSELTTVVQDERLEVVLADLNAEELIALSGDLYTLHA